MRPSLNFPMLGLAALAAASPLTTPNLSSQCAAISSAVSKVKALSTVSTFCSSFLHIPTITATKSVTTTTTVPSTTTVTTGTNTVTASPVTVTASTSTSVTVTSWVTQYATLVTGTNTITASTYTETDTAYATQTAACTNAAAQKRDVLERDIVTLSGIPTNTPGPNHPTTALVKRAAATTSSKPCTIPAALGNMASSVVSSACSCLNIPTPSSTSTVSITNTATSTISSLTGATTTSTPTSTTTLTSTSTLTATSTTTLTSDVAAMTTVTPSATITQTQTSTVTPSCAPTCTQIAINGFLYNNYYSGSGYTENANNPGNDYPSEYPPITTYLDGTLSTCDANNQCAALAYNDPDVYYSYDLHYRQSTQTWECVQYYDPNSDPSQFNVADPDVIAAYGYCIYC